jgi:hypothetical protein
MDSIQGIDSLSLYQAVRPDSDADVKKMYILAKRKFKIAEENLAKANEIAKDSSPESLVKLSQAQAQYSQAKQMLAIAQSKSENPAPEPRRKNPNIQKQPPIDTKIANAGISIDIYI